MRFEGTLKTWHDDRGFGFIEPDQGGQEIFVHIKAFGSRAGRPQLNQRLSFEVEPGPGGKKRAARVEPLRARSQARRTLRRGSPAAWGTATLFVLPLFALLFLAVSVLWRPPWQVAGLYVALSVLAFGAYAWDKSAARIGAWRMAESSLHLVALAGGWPGALLAQQLLRHKSVKREFRAVFWVTVALNVVGFVLLCSPWGQAHWRGLAPGA